MGRLSAVVSQPILCAQNVLDYSKIMIHKGFNAIRKEFPGTRLISAITDSLTMVVLCDSSTYLEKLKSMGQMFDFSNLPSTPLYNCDNAGKSGYWKIEALNILEWISIKNRVYSFLILCDKCKIPYNQECGFCSMEKNQKKKAAYIHRLAQNQLTHSRYRQLLSGVDIKLTCTKLNGELATISLHSFDYRRIQNEKYPCDSFALGNCRYS